MPENQGVICRGCGRKVKVEDVKYDSLKKAYVCGSCQLKEHPSPMGKPKPAESTKPGIFKDSKASDKEIIVKYTCPDCKYKFSRKKGKEATACPYCGGKKIEEVTNDASKILADSDKYAF
jgi:DNA-directed RNA polymerase subunit RPC12/RpoP